MRYIPSNCMRPGQKLAVNLTLDDDRIFLSNKVLLTDSLIERIKSIGFQGAYVEDDISKDLVVANVISQEIKVRAKEEIKTLFCNVENSNDEGVKKSTKIIHYVVEDMVEQILKSSKTMVNIVDIRTFDDYTYSHCLNVAVLSVVMGTVLELNKKILQDLAIAALVHDIGKVFIDKCIINKPGILVPEEFDQMKEHSLKGYEYLRKYIRFSTDIMRGVLEHHEKYNGEGYPYHLSGGNISLFGRIICIADVYDALTSDRPYRSAMLPSDAIEYIMSGYNTLFDPELVNVFIRKIASYPIGTCVELSNGKTGIVIQNSEGLGQRPVIRLIEAGVQTETVIDLNSDQNLNITIQHLANI